MTFFRKMTELVEVYFLAPNTFFKRSVTCAIGSFLIYASSSLIKVIKPLIALLQT